MYEYEDEITARLKEQVKCVKCGNVFPRYEMDGDKCKFCTGKYVDPCKDCSGEDCVCCPHGNNY